MFHLKIRFLIVSGRNGPHNMEGQDLKMALQTIFTYCPWKLEIVLIPGSIERHDMASVGSQGLVAKLSNQRISVALLYST